MKLKNLIRRLMITVASVGVAAPMMLGAAEATMAQTAGYTAAEAVDWVKSLEGQGVDYDGAYGNQCVDLVKAYYDHLGVSAVRGNAYEYAYNELPDGWQRLEGADPEPGDILVYTGGSYGHVAIYTGENESYHQNWGGSYVQCVTGDYHFSGLSYWGVIRPDFEDGDYESSNTDVTYDENSYESEEVYGYEYGDYGRSEAPGEPRDPGAWEERPAFEPGWRDFRNQP